MTQAKPRRPISRTFVGTKERKNFFLLLDLEQWKGGSGAAIMRGEEKILSPGLSLRIQLLLKLSDMTLLFQLHESVYFFFYCLIPLGFFYLHLRE